MSPFDSQYAAPVASVKPKARGGVGACDRQGIENPGCRTRAGQRPDRRRPGLSSVVLAALPFLVFAPAAFSFGEAGHSGMSRWAFDLLQVTNSTGQPISRFPYHGDGFYENLGVASTIPDDLPEGSELLMQPADHYYDPDDPAWVFPFLEWNGHSYQIYGSLEWLGVVYTVIDESVEWQAGRYGIDGSGYNGLSGFLFYLLGGSPKDDGNPTKGTDRAGALQILREISDSPGAPSAETEKDFTDLLGSAFHYLQDIHSAGHTDPSSWYGIKGVTLCPFSVLVLEKGNWHIKFDMTGDAYFEPVDTLECLGNFAECWGEFRGHYNAFQDERRDPDKLPILVYRYKGPPCTYQPERDKPVPPDSDLAQLFHDAAVASKAKMWDPFGDLDDYEAPDATFSVFCSSLAESLDLAARRCAGVVDWVFTMAAEGQEEVDWVGTGQGQVARRDAPNFLGIARAMASGGQVVIVEGDLSIPGKLSGVDQDDFYPLKMASGAWEFRFPTEGEAGPTMALYNDRGDSLAEGSELQCDGPGEVYLRVFSTPEPEDRLLDCQYSVVISEVGPEPVTGDLLGRNLIANGDAEQGESSLLGEMVPVPEWTMTDGFTVLPYYPDSTLLPGVDCPGPEDRGLNLFFGGLWNEWSAAGQGVDVSALQALIDQGKLRYTLSGYLGGWEDQDDVAVLTVSFLDGSAAILDTGSIGPVWPEDRNYATGLLRRTTQGRVPAGTRSLDIELGMWRGGGFWNFNNDGYADNLELYLHVSDAPGAPTD